MGYPNWRTPVGEGKIFTLLDEEFSFTMDAAASHANALLDTYCTEDGKYRRTYADGFPPDTLVEHVKASVHGGLDHELWTDERVFCNPPYTQADLPSWLEAGKETVRMGLSPLTCLLLPPSVDTRWFMDLFGWLGMTFQYTDNDFWLPFKTLDERFEFRFFKGRERFGRPKRTTKVIIDGEAVEIPDETDPETVPGSQPRAGNLVVIHRA